jgi:hypothetical protein
MALDNSTIAWRILKIETEIPSAFRNKKMNKDIFIQFTEAMVDMKILVHTRVLIGLELSTLLQRMFSENFS